MEQTETRTEVILIRVTPTEKTTIIEAAQKVGLNISDFIRLLVRQWTNGIRFEKREEGDNN